MLTELKDSHLSLILCWRNEQNVRQNMYSTEPITEEEHQNWFYSMRSDPARRYFLFLLNGKPTGVIYFTNMMPFNQQTMWGFYGAPDAPIGNGLHMEFEALEFAFIELSVPKLNCEVIGTNKKVINLHLKTGFQQEGLLRDYHFDGHRYVDVVRLGMVRSQWPKAKRLLTKRIMRSRTRETI